MTDAQIARQGILPYLLGLIANKGLQTKDGKLRLECLDSVGKVLGSILDMKKDKSPQLLRRLDRCSHSILLLARDNRNDQVNTHKLLLALHGVAQKMIDLDFNLDKKVVDLVESFLQIESRQTKTFDNREITDTDWSNLKKSADKMVDKIFNKIVEI